MNKDEEIGISVDTKEDMTPDPELVEMEKKLSSERK